MYHNYDELDRHKIFIEGKIAHARGYQIGTEAESDMRVLRSRYAVRVLEFHRYGRTIVRIPYHWVHSARE